MFPKLVGKAPLVNKVLVENMSFGGMIGGARAGILSTPSGLECRYGQSSV